MVVPDLRRKPELRCSCVCAGGRVGQPTSRDLFGQAQACDCCPLIALRYDVSSRVTAAAGLLADPSYETRSFYRSVSHGGSEEAGARREEWRFGFAKPGFRARACCQRGPVLGGAWGGAGAHRCQEGSGAGERACAPLLVSQFRGARQLLRASSLRFPPPPPLPDFGLSCSRVVSCCGRLAGGLLELCGLSTALLFRFRVRPVRCAASG
jgi:hypothetical protein